MDSAFQLVDNLLDLEASIEECIKQKKDIYQRQRERQKVALACSQNNVVHIC